MELLGLDAALQPIGSLTCLNIQWNRRFYEAGDFQVLLRAGDFDPAIAYLYTAERPETGMVQKVETERTAKGDFVLLSGYFLEGMLNWRVLYPPVAEVMNVAVFCRDQVRDRLGGAGFLVPEGAEHGEIKTITARGEPLGDFLYALLAPYALGQRIRLELAENRMIYEIWRGNDRTQSQSQNAFALFGQGFGTVDGLTITRDDSALCNCAIAAYEGGAVTVDARADASVPRREMYVDTQLSPGQYLTPAALHRDARAHGLRALEKRKALMNIDATVLRAGVRYQKDYDLGDRCDVRDDRLQVQFEGRIIEINEVWKEGAHTVSLQFGDKLPTAYGR